MRIVLLAISFMLCSGAIAQQTNVVTGKITDTTGFPLQDVYVKLVSPTDTFTIVTNTSGSFRFQKVSATQFDISASMIGFETYNQSYSTANKERKTFAIPALNLKLQINQLSDVTVVSTTQSL